MEHAKTRKDSIESIAKHLEASAYQALVNTKQAEVARTLGEADSTVMRRASTYLNTMRQLAASKVRDLVMEGEIKIPIEQYRWLMSTAMEFAKIQLELTSKEVNSLAA